MLFILHGLYLLCGILRGIYGIERGIAYVAFKYTHSHKINYFCPCFLCRQPLVPYIRLVSLNLNCIMW